jgi:hypothetical protein
MKTSLTNPKVLIMVFLAIGSLLMGASASINSNQSKWTLECKADGLNTESTPNIGHGFWAWTWHNARQQQHLQR